MKLLVSLEEGTVLEVNCNEGTVKSAMKAMIGRYAEFTSDKLGKRVLAIDEDLRGTLLVEHVQEESTVIRRQQTATIVISKGVIDTTFKIAKEVAELDLRKELI